MAELRLLLATRLNCGPKDDLKQGGKVRLMFLKIIDAFKNEMYYAYAI